MANSQVIDYIRNARSQGARDDQIRQALRDADWTEREINEAFGAVDPKPSGDQAGTVPSAPQPMPVQPAAAVSQSPRLPSIEEHLNLAWEALKKSWKNLFFLTLITVGIYLVFAFLIIGPILLAGFGFTAGFDFGEEGAGFFGLGTVGIVFAVAMGVLMMIVMAWITVVQLIAIRDRHEEPSLGMLFDRSKQYFWPTVTTTILLMILTAGAWILFVLPGIVFVVWFYFAFVAVIFDRKSNFDALFYSRHLVKDRFFSVVGRWILVTVILILVMFIPNIVSSVIQGMVDYGSDAAVGAVVISGIFVLISYAVNLVIGWYNATFYVVFYEMLKEDKKDRDYQSPSRNSKLKVVLVSAAGYIVLALTVVLAVSAFYRIYDNSPSSDFGFEEFYQETDENYYSPPPEFEEFFDEDFEFPTSRPEAF